MTISSPSVSEVRQKLAKAVHDPELSWTHHPKRYDERTDMVSMSGSVWRS